MADDDSTNEVPLFDGYDESITPPPIEKLSPDRRRTIRNGDKLSIGIHPATGTRLSENGERCGTCGNLRRVGGGRKTYLKCGLKPDTNGPGTDIRAWWPACLKWTAIDS